MSGDGADLNSSHLQSAYRKREYKNLLEIGGQTAENVDNNSIADNLIALKDLLLRSNELVGQGTLSDRIGQSAEVVLDAQVCKLASDLMGTTVQKIESDDFSDDAFATALMEHVTDDTNACNWLKLDEYVVKIAATFKNTPSMFGTFDYDHVDDGTQTAQKERRTRRKADPGIEKRPTAVTQSDDAEKKTTKVELIFQKIQNLYQKNGRKPIPYFALVIDPTNMMYTFDNTFQVSFLFRDGLIAFVKDDEGLPAIKPMDESAMPAKPAEMTSFTSSMSHDLIQKYTKKYNIRQPMLNISRE